MVVVGKHVTFLLVVVEWLKANHFNAKMLRMFAPLQRQRSLEATVPDRETPCLEALGWIHITCPGDRPQPCSGLLGRAHLGSKLGEGRRRVALEKSFSGWDHSKFLQPLL